MLDKKKHQNTKTQNCGYKECGWSFDDYDNVFRRRELPPPLLKQIRVQKSDSDIFSLVHKFAVGWLCYALGQCSFPLAF